MPDAKLTLCPRRRGNPGVVQIAFIEALQARGIEPDLVVGTSVGALNESYVAFHQPGREVQYLARDGMGGFQAGVYEGAVRSG